MNPINQELTNYRHMISHYEMILKKDSKIKSGEVKSDGRPLLKKEDIKRINEKLTELYKKRDELLAIDDDYREVQ